MKKRLLAIALALLMTLVFVPFTAAVAAGEYKAEFGAQFNPDVNADVGEWPDSSAWVTNFDEGQEATLTIEFDAPVAFGGNYAAINTDFPFAEGLNAQIISFKLDDNEVAMGAAYLNDEGIDGGLRLTVCNKWNDQIAVQPVDVETLGEFSKMEFVFVVSNEYKAQFGAQFNPDVNGDVGEWPDNSAWVTNFMPGQLATLAVDFGAPVAFGGNYAAIDTDFPFAEGVRGKILSLKLDGEEAEMGAAFLNNEGINGGLRLTICNKWNGDIAVQPVDVETLGEFSKIEITFVVGGEFEARFAAQFNPDVNGDVGEWPDNSAWVTNFMPGQLATLAVDFGAPVAFGGNYAAIDTDFPFGAGVAARIISMKLDGNTVEMGDAFLNNEGIDGGLRLTICNKWNGDIAVQPVDVETLGEFTALELSFMVFATGGAVELPPEKDIPAFDPDGEYKAFLGVQMDNWVFRDAWAHDFYGENGKGWDDLGIGNNFYGLSMTDPPGTYSGVFTDAVIAGNGTYRVSLADWDFAGAEAFNQLYVSTNIPNSGDLTFTDVKVIIGGSTRHTFADGFVFEDTDYVEIGAINIWNADLTGLFNDMVPNGGEIAIEFTVSGFAYDNTPAAPATPAPAPAPTSAPAPANEGGGLSGGIIALIIAGGVLIVGAAAFFVIKKKKNK